jgi:Protein of unknown function (DUF1194)
MAAQEAVLRTDRPGDELGPRIRGAGPIAAAFALVLASAGGAAPQQKGATQVDLALVLAVDVSASMDEDEQALQRHGYAEAFRHSAVINAIRNGASGRIAVTYLEWAQQARQTIPWTIISTSQQARAFAARLDAEPIYSGRRTSISNALATSGALFGEAGLDSPRRVIDISGDGANNAGAPVLIARDAVIARAIVINGLPIILNKPRQWYDIDNLDAYYSDCVIGGRGAFALVVRNIDDFAATIRNKLVTEIADLAPKPSLFQPAEIRSAAKADCLVGEKTWGGGRLDITAPTDR